MEPNLCLGDTFFYSDKSVLNDGSITAIYWDFGGGYSQGSDSSYTIPTTQGSFNLSHKVESSFGCVDSSSQSFDVHFVERINLSQNGNCENEFIQLIANPYSMDSVASVDWHIEGQDYSGQQAQHLFSASGLFKVKQQIVSNRGCVSLDSFDVKIDPAPQALITTDLFCNDNQVRFQSNSSSSQWTLGDGNYSSSDNFVHDYGSVGTYPV